MKRLQLSPPLLIITMGYPGSGKSFFARQFAELYNLPRISEDRVRYELFENPQFNEDEADIISRVMHYMLEQAMQTESAIVCEGGFMSAKSRAELSQIAAANGYRTLVVWLQTDVETSMKRAAVRDRRNPDSKYAFPIDKRTFSRLKDELQRPSEKEPVLVVSGKHAFKSQSLTVLRKIASDYSESASKGDFTTKPSTAVQPQRPRLQNNQRFVQ